MQAAEQPETTTPAAPASADAKPASNTPAAPTLSPARKLSSLAAVVVLAGFVLGHLWVQSRALYGRTSYIDAQDQVIAFPLMGMLEVVLLALMAYHAAYGLALLPRVASEARREASPKARTYLVAQHVTGLLVLLFTALHVTHYRLPRMRGRDVAEQYYRLGVDLNSTGFYVLYAAGVTATVYHLAFGLYQAATRWNVVKTPEGARRAAWASAVVGVLLWALWVNVLWHFALRCGGVLPLPGHSPQAVCGAALR